MTEYDLQLGPLAFVNPVGNVGEAIGDGLEAVGAGVVPGERRPRPMKLKVAVRGSDPVKSAEEGRKLRRQIRQLMNNADYRLQGFFTVWLPDEDFDAWLLISTGELVETDPGITFGEYELELGDTFVRGRPGTHKPGRRASIADLRTGLAPRDTRRRLYSQDFSGQPLPAQPLYLPGDLLGLVRTGSRPTATTPLTTIAGRVLARSAEAEDADVLSYQPNTAVISARSRYQDLDEAGAVKVWDLSKAATYPPVTANYTGPNDLAPEAYGWERAFGDVLAQNHPLAVENGYCRLIWLGAGAAEGLAIEAWDAGLGHYRRVGRVLHALGVNEQRVVYLTPERAILEWRSGTAAMRAVLQRGWWGPRLEAYEDSGETARLEYAPEGAGAVTIATQTPAFVRQITIASGGDPLLWASTSNDEFVGGVPAVITPASSVVFHRQRVIVGQLASTKGPLAATGLASLSLIDARPVPVLIGR